MAITVGSTFVMIMFTDIKENSSKTTESKTQPNLIEPPPLKVHVHSKHLAKTHYQVQGPLDIAHNCFVTLGLSRRDHF